MRYLTEQYLIFNQNTENMLKDMAFCHFQENLDIDMVKS